MHLSLSVLIVVGTVLITSAIAVLAWLPGARARARAHPSARTIAILGWCSLVFWPLWPIAYFWANTRAFRKPRAGMRVRVSPARAKVVGSLKLAEEARTQSA
jgi:hypothetical protein